MISEQPEFQLPSASRLDLAAACPASFALPQTRRDGKYSTRGTALHAYLASLKELGREKALELVPAEWRSDAEVIDVEALPLDVESYLAEVTIAYDVDTGAARVLGQGLERDEIAALLTPREAAGTLDVLGLTPDAVVVPDYKTGHAHLVPREMRQLKAYSLYAARAFKRLKAISGIIRIREDGTSFWQRADFDGFDLDAFELELKDLVHKVLLVRESVSRGVSPATHEGDHCGNCGAFDRCPSKIRLAKEIGAMAEMPEGGNPDHAVGPLLSGITESEFGKAWARAMAMEKVIDRVKSVLRERALRAPIPLPDGKQLGPKDQDEVHIDLAHKALTALYGPDVAVDAMRVEKSMSKDSIEQSVRKHVLRPGMAVGKLLDNTWTELRKAGGLQPVTIVKAHWPPKEEPSKERRPLQLVRGGA